MQCSCPKARAITRRALPRGSSTSDDEYSVHPKAIGFVLIVICVVVVAAVAAGPTAVGVLQDAVLSTPPRELLRIFRSLPPLLLLAPSLLSA